ncbi:peptidase S8/S53 domain-containing protein [Triangularia verruculosa]|uniref:Peptidase S8/S53 domain-containing protein n=1 Tax=Triangularia verruculosa TaxID=2587418 RepID=A0AAN6XPT9_9PEZI|nr:peptidase S8/S53 domain-containing protein [Triangularia verruculosa]
MKFTATLYGLSGLLGLALAAVPIKNDGISADIVVPEKYIVKYKANADAGRKKKHESDVTSKAKKKNKKGVVETIDIDGLSGYVAEIPDSELKELRDSDLIEYIEKDSITNITGVAAPPVTADPVEEAHELAKRAYVTQLHAAWGLARISRRSTWNSGYYYDTTAGQGIRVYVLDTGIRTSHVEFEGRAVWGANYITGSPNTDEYGHGTHVAGTVAGKTYGVAKKATVVAVKVLDKNGSGTMSGLILGLNWAVNNAKARGITKKAVINISLGGGYTAAVNAAVKAATDAGLTVVVSAGNSNANSANYSPASAPSAITVGAIDGTRYRAWFSNWGSSVDIFAPGVSVLSAYHTSNTATWYMDGTSMAAPHVAGLAAYFIAKENLSGSTAVTNRIFGASVTGVVGDPKGSWNRLAYNAGGA